MSTLKTIDRRRGRRKNQKLNDFLVELYEDVMPSVVDRGTSHKKVRKTKNHGAGDPAGFDWGHFFPPNASGNTLVKIIKSKALFLE